MTGFEAIYYFCMQLHYCETEEDLFYTIRKEGQKLIPILETEFNNPLNPLKEETAVILNDIRCMILGDKETTYVVLNNIIDQMLILKSIGVVK